MGVVLGRLNPPWDQRKAMQFATPPQYTAPPTLLNPNPMPPPPPEVPVGGGHMIRFCGWSAGSFLNGGDIGPPPLLSVQTKPRVRVVVTLTLGDYCIRFGGGAE